MYFLGHAADTSFGSLRPKELQFYGAHSEFRKGVARCGDESTVLTHEQQCARARAVDADRALPTDVGSHGTSPFVSKLKYVHYNNLFVVPVAHAGLLGVVKDFWNHVLSTTGRGEPTIWFTISSQAKAVMKARSECVVATCDFGRSYTDIISKKGNWVMEDWLHWAECWSVFVLRPYVDSQGQEQPILHPDAAEMWQHLRAGLLYFCRTDPVEGVAQNVDSAQAELQKYAALVEQRLGLRMCKFNLHLIVCRLARQEAARGRAAHSTEYWIENLIQWAKSTVRYRTTKYPELVLAGDILLDDAIARCLAEHDDVRAALFEWEHVDGCGTTHRNPDDAASDGSQMLGPGRILSVSERETLQVDSAVRTFIQEFQSEAVGWTTDMVGAADILLYTYAQAQGGELLHSTRYTRARTRVSYNVMCEFREGERSFAVASEDEVEVLTPYVGRVKHFVKVVPPGLRSEQDGSFGMNAGQGGDDGMRVDEAEPLRLAVIDLHVLQRVEVGGGVSYQSVTYSTGLPSKANTAVSLSFKRSSWGRLVGKYAFAQEKGAHSPAVFLPYSNLSGSSSED